MTSLKMRFSGYLKQLVGEVTGSQALHEKGKREVLGTLESEPAGAVTPFEADGQRDGARSGSTAPLLDPGNKAGSSSGPLQKEKLKTVYTQLLPDIEAGAGPYVKVSSEDEVLYVPLSEGDPFDHAKNAIIKLSENLTARSQRVTAPTEAELRQEQRRPRDANEIDDPDDRLQIGLEDSFPASDPPAAAARSTLPKTRDQ